jgi:hypothetical protein
MMSPVRDLLSYPARDGLADTQRVHQGEDVERERGLVDVAGHGRGQERYSGRPP